MIDVFCPKETAEAAGVEVFGLHCLKHLKILLTSPNISSQQLDAAAYYKEKMKLCDFSNACIELKFNEA